MFARLLAVALCLLPLSACASRPMPPPFIGNEFPKIDPDKGRCFEAEREPGPEGGLRIPRQNVCPTVNTPTTKEDS